MFSVGKIAGGLVADITGNEDLGKLVGLGVDLYMGNYAGAADQLRGMDFGGGNVFSPEPGYDSYDYDAGGYGDYDYDYDYGASEYLAEQRETDAMYATARETDDWSGVVDYEMSQEEFSMEDEDGNVIEDAGSSEPTTDDEWEADLQATLDDTEDLLDETNELDDGIEDLADYEADEQTANDTVRTSQRA